MLNLYRIHHIFDIGYSKYNNSDAWYKKESGRDFSQIDLRRYG
jgi:hypothetical protein